MTLDRRITMVSLGVADVARSTTFYEKLGWSKSAASNDDITFVKLKGVVLGLYSREGLAQDAGVEDSTAGFSGVALAHNLDSEKAVDEAFAFAVSCGAEAVKRPQIVFWGGYSSYFADPDGHLWELAYNPFAPLDDDGHMVLP